MTSTPFPRWSAAVAIVVVAAASSAGAQATSPAAPAAPAAPAIRLSQIGFLPRGPKVAVVTGVNASNFAIVGADHRDTVLRGSLTAPKPWALSGEENVRRAEFGS